MLPPVGRKRSVAKQGGARAAATAPGLRFGGTAPAGAEKRPLIVKERTKEESSMSAVALKEEAARRDSAHDMDEDLRAEYEKAMQEYGLPYPDGTWFKRAARLERQMREARMEARFDEN